jgi:hypothetical protein
MFYSTSQLDRKELKLSADHPLVVFFKEHDECLLMEDFKSTALYRAMWESEKKILNDWKIECFLPLKDEETLIGIVMLEHKEKYRQFTYDDMNFLGSVESVASIAVKNSRLYEKAYEEARRDDLTGLYNRKCFYELLQQEYEACQSESLALVMIDIDDFKLYNQLYGNREGDQALVRVAGIIQEALAKMVMRLVLKERDLV